MDGTASGFSWFDGNWISRLPGVIKLNLGNTVRFCEMCAANAGMLTRGRIDAFHYNELLFQDVTAGFWPVCESEYLCRCISRGTAIMPSVLQFFQPVPLVYCICPHINTASLIISS